MPTCRLQQLSEGHALSSLTFHLLQTSGLMKQLGLQPVVVARFLRAVEDLYRDNP